MPSRFRRGATKGLAVESFLLLPLRREQVLRASPKLEGASETSVSRQPSEPFWRQYEEISPKPSRNVRDGNNLTLPEYSCICAVSYLYPGCGHRLHRSSHSGSDADP